MPSARTSAAERVIRAAYSSTRLPPKTRCVCGSMNPGATILPVTSMTRARVASTWRAISSGAPTARMRSPAIAMLAPARRPMGSDAGRDACQHLGRAAQDQVGLG